MDKVKVKPAFEVEGIEGGYLGKEDGNDQASGLYVDENLIKGLTIDDTSCIFHYELYASGGGLDSIATGEGKDEFRYGGFHALLPEDEMVDLYPTIELSDTYYEYYYQDIDFSKTVPELDYYFYKDTGSGSGSENLRVLSHSPGISNDAMGSSESFTPLPMCQSDQHEKTTMITTCESGDSCGSKYGCEMLIKDETGTDFSSIHYTLEVEEANDVVSSMEVSNSYLHRNKRRTDTSNDLEDIYDASPVDEGSEGNGFTSDCTLTEKRVKLRKVGTCIGNKRTKRPNCKYAEETPDFKSCLRKRKVGTCIASKEDNHVDVRSHNRLCRSRAKAVAMVACEILPSQSSQQELDESDEEYDPFRSNFRIKRLKRDTDRRKHNNVWTLSEVMKLVDGISQFGVGKWTAIQKGFFASSPHRTSLDIRDKWRNLLRTSYSRLQSHKADVNNWKNGSIALPETLIHRICELDSMHPYPGHDLKLSCSGSRDNSLSLTE